jgi:thiamine biosynthesis protein ThiS
MNHCSARKEREDSRCTDSRCVIRVSQAVRPRIWSKILTIRLNGEAYDIAGPVSISALLAALNIDPRIVAVEHNVVVVKRQRYDDTIVNDGDEVEIVRFVGGG